MEGSDILAFRDSVVVSILDVFGISYFSIFILQCLFFDFPVAQSDIIDLLATLLFGIGVISWCLLSLAHRILVLFGSNGAPNWEKLEFLGVLLLIYTTTISYVAIEFSPYPVVQLGYSCAISLFFVTHVVELCLISSNEPTIWLQFQYHCTCLGSLAMIPILHAITGSLGEPTQLAKEFTRLAVYNGIGALQYLAQPWERIGLFHGWHPSLYIMHLILIFNAVIASTKLIPVR
ncbi:hypothetical protein N7478_003793 [Penicillium angulare]|uniref:uncharacterized protein n=1 Tax=Penicillium angulare TaxID=116970 RepID=UPI00253F766F|nr:uncharacterized protein N7478_003793 [Penicillium angulare]KAJ5288107.1 hypothetical protein N7478_003793 [Penicillium angulare]